MSSPTKTLRDEIAISAMLGLIQQGYPWNRIPEAAYLFADQMLLEKDKKT